MKKNVWTKMVSLALVLICLMGLAACSNGSSSSAAGTYTLQTITVGGLSMDLAQLAEFAQISEDEMKITLDLKSGGSFTLDMSSFDETMSMEGTWEEKGSEISLTAEGETITATLEDGVITLSAEGTSMTFKK